MHETSIVILTRNGIDLTRACLASIERCTDEPYELIIVDNGSTDGTVEWLRTRSDVLLVENGENLGFGAACNQGMALARGDRILLLNNDTVVTRGWLAAMQRELDAEPTVGFAGPRSNRVAGAQLVPDPGYDVATRDGLDAWADAWCAANAGSSDDVLRIIGFCLLVKREVVDAVGGFDLRFAIGNFEDDDLCMRACIAGWHGRIVHDSFVHHAGSATFAAEQVAYGSLMAENFARFVDKWRLTTALIAPDGTSYDAAGLVAGAAYSESRHYEPLVARCAPAGATLDVETRSSRLLVCCDRTDTGATRTMLAGAFAACGPTDDVTVVVRVDPRDDASWEQLDAVADEAVVEVPDVVVIEADERDDDVLVHACDLVVVAGRRAWSLSAHARARGSVPVTALDLVDGLALPHAA